MMTRESAFGHADNNARQRDVYLALALLFSCVAALPLFWGPGVVNTRAGGDVPFMWQRVYELSESLRAGVFPVRWMAGAAYGLGYPAFNYYASLPYYMAAILNLCGCGILVSIQIVQLGGFLLAGCSVYKLARELDATPQSALLASTLYTMAPFHLVNVYVRGDSLAEFWAMALFPLSVWCLLRLVRRSHVGNAVALGASYAALVLCHNISAMVLSPWLGIWALARAWRARRDYGWRPTVYGAGALALGLALSAWFWAPALRETSLAQLGDQTSGYFSYAGHFRGANLVQWRLAHDYAINSDQDPFQMGLVQALFGLAGLVVTAIRWRNEPGQRLDWIIIVGAFLGYTLLVTPLSAPIWKYMPLLDFTQFPWRLLGPQALALALLAWPIVELVPSRRTAAALALCALVAVAGMARLAPGRIPVREGDLTQERFMLYEMYSDNIGGTVRAEYLPQEMTPRPYTSGVQLAGGELPVPLVLEGLVNSSKLTNRAPTDQLWEIDVENKALLAFHTTFFPGWEAVVDGQPQGVEPLQGLGMIGLRLDSGHHKVRLFLGDTPTRKLANGLSLLAVLVTVGLLAVYAANNRPSRVPLGIAGACVVLMLGWAAIAPQPVRCPSDDGLLVMDFGWAPYLHHEPQGIVFDRAGDDDSTYSHLVSCEQSAAELCPGDTLHLEFDWVQADPAHKVRLRLQSALAHHASRAPYWAEVEVENLSPGELSVDVPLADDLPPGVYVVAMSVRQHGDGTLTETWDGNGLTQVAVAPIRVTGHRQATGEEPILGQYGAANAPVAISLVGVSGERVDEDRLEVGLTWRSEWQAPLNYQLSLRLHDGDGNRLDARDMAPLLGGYPTSLWRPGELVGDRVWLEIDDDYVFSGKEELEVVLYDVRTMEGAGLARLPLGDVKEQGD